MPTYYADALDYLARRLGVPTRSDVFRLLLVEMALEQARPPEQRRGD